VTGIEQFKSISF